MNLENPHEKFVEVRMEPAGVETVPELDLTTLANQAHIDWDQESTHQQHINHRHVDMANEVNSRRISPGHGRTAVRR